MGQLMFLDVLVSIVIAAATAFFLDAFGVVPLAVSGPWVVGFTAAAVLVAVVIALDLIGIIYDAFLKRRLRRVEAQYPGSRATALSCGSILLTDRSGGFTIGVLDRNGVIAPQAQK